MECTQTSCEGGLRCCVKIDYYPGFYCKIVSQCEQQPLWQVILIPSLLALLTLVLAIIILVKLKSVKRDKRTLSTYVYQQIRVKPRSRDPEIVTYTTLPGNIQPPDNTKLTPKQTEATPNTNRPTINTINSPY